MIIKVDLSLKSNILPADYHPAFVSLIKHSLNEFSKELYSKYYEKNNFTQKNFTFALALSKPVFNGEKIRLETTDASMTLHTSEPPDGIDLYNSFIKQTGKAYPLPFENSVTIKKVSLSNHRKISSGEIIIKMRSPLLVRKHEDKKDFYMAFNHEDFQKYFFMSVSKLLSSIYNIEINENSVFIEPVSARKTVVSTFGSKITGNIGTYRLKAAPELLNILCQTGLGSRRSQGFGCFDVIQEVM